MSNKLIINYFRSQDKFKLIFAKNNILKFALEDLSGYSFDIHEYVRVFEQINGSSIMDKDNKKELTEKLYDLTCDEDFRVTESDKIESLCEKIRVLNTKIPEKAIFNYEIHKIKRIEEEKHILSLKYKLLSILINKQDYIRFQQYEEVAVF
jgi:hypothetical protein